MSSETWLGRRVDVAIEMPAWSFAKVRADGRVTFVSPVPCPWAYGALPDVPGGDGDALDALVLDVRGRRGQRVTTTVQGVVRFLDGGAVDDKLICAEGPPGRWQRSGIVSFLRAYALAKRALGRRMVWQGTVWV